MASHGTELLVISGAEVMRLVQPAAALAVLEDGFKALARGEVQAPARPKIDVPGKGFTLGMLAWAPSQFITLKTVSVFHGNHALGMESHQAVVSLFDPETGAPVALLDGASLTGIRTAGAAVLSVRTLARRDARVATVVGAGVQGREHVRLLDLARDFTEIRVFARTPGAAERLAETHPRARAVDDLEAAIRTSDVVCLTTAASEPVIEAEWLKPGTHVTSVGYTPPGTEVPRRLIETAAICVESMTALAPEPVGCSELARIDPARVTALGDILLGRKPGRRSDDEFTLYKSMGNAMEDLVVANLAYAEARRQGVGTRITL
jgi:alanine dehydrogenase